MGKIAAIVDNNVNIIKTNDLNNNHHQQQSSEQNSNDNLKLNGFMPTLSNNIPKHKQKSKPALSNKTNGKIVVKNNKTIVKSKNIKNGKQLKSKRRRQRNSNKNKNKKLSKMNGSTISNASAITTSSANETNNSNNQKKISSYQDQTNILTYFDPTKKVRDPLTLVECHHFDDSIQSPVVVKIKLEALLLMDLHAHCSHNEVIGCLGGYYCRVTKTLYVLTTVPGSSIEDRFNQCELDSVSYVNSIEVIEKQNLKMVGWYHSHPKFSTKPSILDIQTQKCYQGIFLERYINEEKNKSINNKQEKINDNLSKDEQQQPLEENERTFVGFIITPFLVQPIGQTLSSKSFTRYQPHSERSIGSKFIANNIPYDYHHRHDSSYCYFTPELNSILASTIKCFWASSPKYSKDSIRNNPQRAHCLVPYEIETTMIRDECFISSIANGLSQLCIKILSDNDEKEQQIVDLFQQFTRIGSIYINYLEKIIASLSHHLQNPKVNYLCTEEELARIRDQCVAILSQELARNRKIYGHTTRHRQVKRQWK